jgi:hypothetical protein
VALLVKGKNMAKINGYVIWRGASMLDGAPIALVANGFHGASNDKTGAGLIQTYIIRDDMRPTEASRNGADVSVCGDCKHRGEYKDMGGTLARIAKTRRCYVVTVHGPLNAYKSMHSGLYPAMPEHEIAEAFAGRMVRIGAYGDGAAIPEWVWRLMLSNVADWTGYTHQWRNPAAQWMRDYCMASVDSLEEMHEAQAMGWRTFRVAPAVDWTREKTESLCPASKEAGAVIQCDKCLRCSGLKGHGKQSVMIPDHSATANAVKRLKPSVTVRRVAKAA